MVGAVENNFLTPELLAHPLHQDVEIGVSASPARQPNLMRHHHEAVAETLRFAAEGEDTIHEADLFYTEGIAGIAIDCRVAAQKQCGFHGS
jgi:hypothetical protein